MPSRATDAEDELAKRGLIGCNVPLDDYPQKVTIDPLWLLEFLHKEAKDLKAIEIDFNDRSIHLVHCDKKLEMYQFK